MVKFYRPATSEDFEKYDDSYDFDRPLSSEVQKLISDAISEGNQKPLIAASRFLYYQYGYEMQKSREQIRAYYCYLLAKKDHEEGKTVFIEYSDGL